MKKLFVYLIAVMSAASCSRTMHSVEETPAPEHIQFEVLRTSDPQSGEIPSHLKYELIEDIMGEQRYKAERLYPNTWSAVDDQFASLAITKMDYDKQDPSIFYFCSGEGWGNADAARGAGVWKSIDAGQSWQRLNSTDSSTFYYCQDLVVHPSTGDVYVATRADGLLRSKDGGASWEYVLNVNNGSSRNEAADIEIASNGDIYVTIGMHSTDGIYYSKSGDAGSWEKRMNGLPTSPLFRIEIATAQRDSNVIYALPESTDDSIAGVYRSDDMGLNWVELPLPGGNRKLANAQSWYDLIIAVDPNNEDVVVAGGLNLWRSRDGGQNWQQLTEGDRRKNSSIQYVHVDQHEIVFRTSDTVYFTNDGGIYRCDDFTADTPFFFQLNQNYNTTQFYSGDIDPRAGRELLLGGTQDNGSNLSSGDGISDFINISWADGSFCAIDHQDPNYLYTTTQYRRIFRTYKGKRDTLTNPQLRNDNTLFINPISMDPNDPQIIYQASNIGLWRLKNARSSNELQWEKACRNFGLITAIGISKSAPNMVCIARYVTGVSNSIPYRIENAHITDAGYTPVPMDRDQQLPRGAYLNCITIDPENEDHVILVYTNYNVESVFETYNATDNDPDWVSVEGNLPNIPIRWASLHPEDPSICYLATEMGLYYTDQLDGGNTVWQKGNESLPNLRMDMIKYRESDHTFMIASHGRGFYTGSILEGSNDIVWEERGPSNIGGRTRTLLIDPNDASGKKVWAGSVSGGLWVANDIDSVALFKEINQSNELNVHPNPVHGGFVKVYFDPSNQENVQLRIYNKIGQLIYSKEVIRDGDVERVVIPILTPGIYFFELKQAELRKVKRMIIP